MFQGALFPPDSAWAPPRLVDLPSNWNASPRLGIDTETCDPLLKKLGIGVRRGGFVAGVSFAFNEDHGHYLPLRHLGGDNVEDRDRAVEYLRDQAARYEGEVVGAKLSYDLDYLAEMGIHFPRARAFLDVQVAEPLLDELQYSYGLDSILGRWGLPLKDEALLRDAASAFKVDPKAELWKLPARYVGPYATADATRPLSLLRLQEAEIEAQGLRRIWELECAVLPILVKMRRRGVRVDFDRLDRVERFSVAEETKAWGELQRLTGVAVRVGDAMKAEVIAHALAAVDIACPLTPGRGKKGPVPSVTKEWLEALDHPAGKVIRRARKMSQLRSTFVASVRAHAIRDRIHTTFNQIKFEKDEDSAKDESEGAAYGRLSSCDPNLQQQPARDPELGPMWRGIYLPDEGGEWCSADYSQQEPRMAVHYGVASGAHRLGLALRQRARRGDDWQAMGRAAHASALAAAKRYHDDPSTDSHTMFTKMVYGDEVEQYAEDGKATKVFKTKRDECKQIYLGVCYGMGGPKLCRKIGKPTKVILIERTGRRIEVAGDEGQAILDLVDKRVPYVKATAAAVEMVAKERGYVVTVGGRRCRFPKDQHGNPDWTHKAFNRVIQGSAADQTKTAMVALDREGFELQLQVHDEFDWTIASRAEGERAAEIMATCMPLNVPSKVDIEVGPSWGEAH